MTFLHIFCCYKQQYFNNQNNEKIEINNCITKITNKINEEDDVVALFFDTCTITGSGKPSKIIDLYTAFCKWYKNTYQDNKHVPNDRYFSKGIKKYGLVKLAVRHWSINDNKPFYGVRDVELKDEYK